MGNRGFVVKKGIWEMNSSFMIVRVEMSLFHSYFEIFYVELKDSFWEK